MLAMVMERVGEPLVEKKLPPPDPGPRQIRVRVKACGICRTDRHVLDGDLPSPKLPLIPGHEVVGEVDACGAGVARWSPGDAVAVPWLAWTCGKCRYCRRGEENLCSEALFHGYTVDGGYAEQMVAHEDYCLPIPRTFLKPESAPLLCAGLIGYRSYRKTRPERVARIGLYGFGASARLVAQVAISQGKEVYAFTREGDERTRKLALDIGCRWAGASNQPPPAILDAAIIFAPVGELMVEALKHVDKGGRVVSAGIHMSPIPEFDYRFLWEERSLHSVANLSREDGAGFLSLAEKEGFACEVRPFPLNQANAAIHALREGSLKKIAVLVTNNE